MKKLLVILGPTASGKSDLAVELAKKFNGEIISADSRQVYKGLDIGSGKITKEEMEGIPHYLLDVISPKRTFTVAQFKKLAQEKLEEIWKHGKLPIICGGTGFYIQALVDNTEIPEVKPNKKLRKELEKKSLQELTLILAELDPKRFQTIDTQNPRRLVRAIEIATALGKVPKANKKGIDAQVLQIGIQTNNESLKEKIAKRLEERFTKGMVNEVKNLNQSGVSWKKLESFGLEYRYIAFSLQGKIEEGEMKKKLLSEIWQYAKRQKTWFKKDKQIKWFPLEQKEEIEKEITNFLKK